jgi:hypothetical protein
VTRRYRDPEAPEVLEAVLERIRRMTRDEWLQELAWHPEGVEETWRMQRVPDREPPEITAPLLLQPATDDSAAADSEVLALAQETGRP